MLYAFIVKFFAGLRNSRLTLLTSLTALVVGAVFITGCTLPAFVTSPCALSTLTVTKTEDTNDGACSDTDCSLREAIIASNSCTGTQTIQIPAGTYHLTRTGADEDAADTGDLDITSGVVIEGRGATTTIIDGNLSDRIFDIKAGQPVFLSGLTLQNGQTPQYGSAIANQGNLTMDHMLVQKNTQTDPKGSGGTIFSFDAGSSLEISSSAVVNNAAAAGAGGLYNVSGNISVENVTISGNQGYAVANLGGQVSIKFSTLAGDNADYEIWNPYNGQSVSISNSILAGLTKNGNCMQPLASGGYNIDNAPRGTLHSCGLGGLNDLMDTDPKLQPLGDNGGNTLTMALAPSSPAVNSANLQTCSTMDQRDVARPQGEQCDRGAYELENPPASPTATPKPKPTPIPPEPTARPQPVQPHDPTGATFTFQLSGNCRQGPSIYFKFVNAFSIGQSVTVIGQNLSKDWLQVKVPASSLTCWVATSLGTLGGSNTFLQIVQTPAFPQTPAGFTDTSSCNSGQRKVVLSWTVDPSAAGYYIYRKDKLITTLPGRQFEYTDVPPYQNDFIYSIESFNDYGVSVRATTTSLGCQ